MSEAIITLVIPESKCPACGGKMFGVWVVGKGNNHYGEKCDSCNRSYVLRYYPETKQFGLRPATISPRQEPENQGKKGGEMDFYKKEINDDIIVKIFDENGNYSVASKNNPEPEAFIHHPDHDLRGWIKISNDEAERILGYDPTE